MQKTSLSNDDFEDPNGSEFPLQYINPNAELVEQNAYRKHDRKYGVLTEVKTTLQYINGAAWLMIFIIFIPHVIVVHMLDLIILKGSPFWQRVVACYRKFAKTGITGFYEGYCESRNAKVHGCVYSIGDGYALDILHGENSETRIELGHLKLDNMKNNNRIQYYMCKQTINGEHAPIQRASFNGRIFQVEKRDSKILTATFTSPETPGLKLSKMNKQMTLIFLISYCFSLLTSLVQYARNPWNSQSTWISKFNIILKALNKSASFTKAVYSPIDQLYDTKYIRHLDSVSDNKKLATELALRVSDPNHRSTIGIANRLVLNDLETVVKPITNQTSSES